MSKLDPLATVSSGFNSTTNINENFVKIAQAFDNTLSRDGCAPNFMDAPLDMNSNRIINLGDPVDGGDAINLTFFQNNPGADTFATFAVSGQPDVVPTVPSDTLTLIEGANITITTNAAGRTIRIDAGAAGLQNLWETITGDVGVDLVPNIATDTLNFVGGTNMTITSDGTDTLTFDAVAALINTFGTIAVSGEGDVVADSSTDTLTLVAGSGIVITTVPGTDTIAFASTAINVGATAFTTEEFIDGIGYDVGVDNSITLSTTPFSKDSLLIFFTGITQHIPQFSLAGNVVTFTSTIPLGVATIQVYILSDPVYGQFSVIPDIPIVAAGAIGPTAHLQSGTPTHYELSLVCQNAALGHSPGDVVPIDLHQSSNRGVALKFDATNVTGRFGSDANTFEILDFTTGTTTAITNGDWELRIRLLG